MPPCPRPRQPPRRERCPGGVPLGKPLSPYPPTPRQLLARYATLGGHIWGPQAHPPTDDTAQGVLHPTTVTSTATQYPVPRVCVPLLVSLKLQSGAPPPVQIMLTL